MDLTISNVSIFLTPIVAGYTMSALCPMTPEQSGSSVPARPPGWVFGVVWPVLYILIGLSWVQLRTKQNIKDKDQNTVDILFSLLILTLNSWIYFYSCKDEKKSALYTLLIALLIALSTWGYSIGHIQMFYLTPLVCWLFFATMLNFTEVNNLLI